MFRTISFRNTPVPGAKAQNKHPNNVYGDGISSAPCIRCAYDKKPSNTHIHGSKRHRGRKETGNADGQKSNLPKDHHRDPQASRLEQIPSGSVFPIRYKTIKPQEPRLKPSAIRGINAQSAVRGINAQSAVVGCTVRSKIEGIV